MTEYLLKYHYRKPFIKIRPPKYFIVFFYLFLLQPAGIRAQENSWFKKITIEEGLAHNTVYAIMQDREGFMWLGTKNGLNCYDGYTYKVYNISFNDSASLSSSWINVLFEDSKGNIWVGTEGGGVNCMDRITGRIEKYSNILGEKNSLCNDYIYAITENAESEILIGTNDGISILDSSRKNFRTFRHNHSDPASLSFDNIYDILIDSSKKIWVATYGGGLELFDMASGKFTHFRYNPKDPGSISSDTLWQVRQDRVNNSILWISTSSGLNKFNTATEKFTHYNFSPGKSFSITANRLQPLLVDEKNRIWAGTDEAGLFCLDQGSSDILHFENIPTDRNSLSDNSILSLYQDRSGLIWVGTRNAGVNLLIESAFRNMNKEFQGSQLKDAYMLYGQDNYIWMGTKKGLFRYDKLTRDIQQFQFTRKSFSEKDKEVYCLFVDADGDLWVGTKNAGLYLKSKNSTSFRGFQFDARDSTSVSGNSIFSIAQDFNGTMWIGTYTNGLNSFDKRSGKFRRYSSDPKIPNSISGDIIVDILPEKGNILWVALSGGGLDRLDLNTGSMTRYFNNPNDTTSLDDDFIKCLYRNSDTTICIGTYSGGLNILNVKTGKFAHYKREAGLPSNTILAICEDKRHNLWMSTDNGLVKLDLATGHLNNYGPANGLPDIEYHTGSVLMDGSGKIFFGSTNGVVFFDPEAIRGNDYAPAVTLTDFSIDNTGARRKVFSAINLRLVSNDSIYLNYIQSSFSFSYSSMLFAFPGKNHYRHILEGFENRWSTPNNLSNTSYSNIPPGKYVFRVKAANIDGDWNGPETTIYIFISPPFWKTAWFRILSISTVLLLIFALIRFRERALRHNQELLTQKILDKTIEIRKQNEKIILQRDLALRQKSVIEKQNAELEKHRTGLELLVRERTADLELAREKAEESDRLKSAFIANMSHEIRTPMNAIIGLSGLLMNDGITQAERVEFIRIIVNNGNTLIRLIDDLLDVSIIDAGRVRLRLQECNADEILAELYEIFSNKLKNQPEKHITLARPSFKEKPLILSTDHVRFSQVMSNLLDNAIKFTENGSVEFGYDLSHFDATGHVCFYVKDTGIGLQKDQIEKLFQRFSRVSNMPNKLYRGTGLGLSICKSLVELMGGTIWVESEFQKGSTFFFSLPASGTTSSVSSV